MDICHLTINHIDFERRIKNQAESSKLAGHTAWIIALGKPGDTAEIEISGISVKKSGTPFHRGGPLKFIHFNIKVILYLLFKPLEVLHCHDLWIMPAAMVLSIFKKFKIVYDAHEYFEGLEIFNQNKIRKKLWMIVERTVIKKIDILLTVSEPIARLYKQKYPALREVEVIRNVPWPESLPDDKNNKYLPDTNMKIVIFQGHFKPGRGLLLLIEAMMNVQGAVLVLIGGGELEDEIKKKIERLNLHNKVILTGYIPTDQLIKTASCADLGVVLFEQTSLNYTYALPNKFFEYIMAGLPVLASNLETFEAYIKKFEVGLTVGPNDIGNISRSINLMLADESQMNRWREKAKEASKVLNWENESKKLTKIYEKLQA